MKKLVHKSQLNEKTYEIHKYSTFFSLRVLQEGKVPQVHTGKTLDYVQKIMQEYKSGMRVGRG